MPPRKTRPKSATKSAAGSKAPPEIATTGVVVADTDMMIEASATDSSNAAATADAATADAVLTATTTTDACNSQPEEPIQSVTYSSIAVNANVHESLIEEGATVKSPLEVAIENYFGTPSVAEFDDNTPHIYKIGGDDSVFTNKYWKWSHRFATTTKDGMLYRPEIVNDIYEIIKAILCNRDSDFGLMIKGPQGIGKSHSIVNLVRKLLSTRNYLVTFIPHCNTWRTSYDLVNAICDSFGASYDLLGFPYSKRDMNEYDFKEFIKAVDAVLKKENKQWIFVFDQINRIFARFPEKKDIGVLDFPFDMMGGVISAGRITSIISASANNEISYKSQHPGFLEYIHRTNMTNEELQKVYGNNNFDGYLTGNVPLLVREFILDEKAQVVPFTASVMIEVELSLDKLMKSLEDKVKPRFISNMCEILLGCAFDSFTHYDKKNFVITYDERSNRYSYRVLSPLIGDIARKYFWTDLMKYIAEKEVHLLQVMDNPITTNDTRGRLFEALVVQRCIANGVNIISMGRGQAISMVKKQSEFHGSKLPYIIESDASDGVYAPTNCNFPAVDMVWKSGKNVYGVQVHISNDHDDVAPDFWNMCQEAAWFSKFNVFLLYLSPNKECSLMKKTYDYCKGQGSTTRRGGKTKENISIDYIAIDAVECLKDLQVPLQMLNKYLKRNKRLASSSADGATKNNGKSVLAKESGKTKTDKREKKKEKKQKNR